MKKIENMEARLVALDASIRDFNVATSGVYSDVKRFLKIFEDYKKNVNRSVSGLLNQAADLSRVATELYELMDSFHYHTKNSPSAQVEETESQES